MGLMKMLIQTLKGLFAKHEHEFVFEGTSKVEDWRVSQNTHLDTHVCACGFRQSRTSYRNSDGELEAKIPALQGECELSMR